jgi:NTE family protein
VGMSRALVLGGGGPVGIGWESGLAVGLTGEGIHFGEADMIVGTSAGSVVGAQLALAMDLSDGITQMAGAPLPVVEGSVGIEGLMVAMAEAAAGGGTPEEGRIIIGRVATEAKTVPEDVFLGAFDLVKGRAWPEAYACTAVDVETGDFQIWDSTSGVELQRAIASSCSVPGVFPPISIGGKRYMDGGMRSALNADAAVGHDVVIAVSCFALALPEGMSDPMFDALSASIEAEFTRLRTAGAALEVIAPSPEFLELSGWGLNLMDPTLAAAAFDVGVRQAALEAERLRAVWKP